jgi:hypothetical protein
MPAEMQTQFNLPPANVARAPQLSLAEGLSTCYRAYCAMHGVAVSPRAEALIGRVSGGRRRTNMLPPRSVIPSPDLELREFDIADCMPEDIEGSAVTAADAVALVSVLRHIPGLRSFRAKRMRWLGDEVPLAAEHY